LSLAGQDRVTPELTRRAVDRRILALAIPALGALAAEPLLSMVDTAYVSRLGVAELGALGVNGAIFGFTFVIFNFLAYATTPLVAQALGRGNEPQAAQVVGRAVWLAASLGVLITVAMVIGAGGLVGLMQARAEVTEPALSYLRVKALAAPAVLIITAAQGAFRGFQDNRTPLKVVVAANVANAVIDPILIFGLGWGIAGAALGSVIGQWGGAVWFLVLLRRRFGPLGLRIPRWHEIAGLATAGGVLTVRTLFLVTALALGTAAAADTGTTSLAAHQVVRETWFLTAMLVDGLAIAAQAMIAEQVGRNNHSGVRLVTRRLLLWGGLVGIALTGAWFLGAEPLGRVFAPDAVVENLVAQAARIAGVMAPVAALVWVMDGVFLGQLRLRVLAASTAAGALAGTIGFLLTERFGWGLSGVWWSIAALVAGRGVVFVWVRLSVPDPWSREGSGSDRRR
jgi:MATE family multidrug resistance protein